MQQPPSAEDIKIYKEKPNMITITKDQIDNYINWNVIQVEDNTDLQEATKLEKEGPRLWETSKKVHKLFLSAAENYIKQAEDMKDPQHQALLYAKGGEILTKHHEYDGVLIKLKEDALCREAIACANAAQAASDCSEEVSWTCKTATLLAPHPEKLPISSDSEEIPDNYIKAAGFWEKLGDLFLTHKENITTTYQFKATHQSSSLPQTTAATYYRKAFFSIRNANYIQQDRTNKYDWNDLNGKQIKVIDKAINALESMGNKNQDLFFDADFSEMLAGLYQLKLNTYKTGKKENVDYSDLSSKIFKLRKESAELFGKILEKNPNINKFYYNKALNLREAAHHVKTVGECTTLMEEAASAACEFRANKNLPFEYLTYWESDEDRDAYEILASFERVETLLAEKGPDHPLPERA